MTAPTERRVRLEAVALECVNCGESYDAAPMAICEVCLGPLVPHYDSLRPLPDRREIDRRGRSIWRYREWLPLRGEPELSTEIGFTPLIEAPALAKAVGVERLWVKNDAVSFPSLSFKDRVVSVALNAARALRVDTVGCASTGNLANAVASQAARAGLPAWILIPEDLETGKVIGTTVYGPRVVRVRGHYDHVNRLCSQLADRYGWGIVNVNLRAYYGEGSKTMAFEISEQLGWRFPDSVIAPMAGGSLVTKLAAGFTEFESAGLVAGKPPSVFGAQAGGCAPIVKMVHSGARRVEPVEPNTIARSIAIGNPADGARAMGAILGSGGWAESVSDTEMVDGIRLLAATTGIFAETAGGVTVAAARKLAGQGRLGREVVLCITGNGLKTIEAVKSEDRLGPLIDPDPQSFAKIKHELEREDG